PEAYLPNLNIIANKADILLGIYNTREDYEWYKRSGLYNFRMGSGRGSLTLDRETVDAKYLLLHTKGDKKSGKLWRIVSKGPRVYSKKDLPRKGYPSDEPSQENYLVIEIEPVEAVEFKGMEWDFRKLDNFKSGRASGIPFTANLTELMKCKVE